MTGILDGTVMVYTYEEMGTVHVAYEEGKVSFRWTDGALRGEAGEGFTYSAREIREGQFFVHWHEPEARGFVTLLIDFPANQVHSSVLAGYGTDEVQVLFHPASIGSVERPGTT